MFSIFSTPSLITFFCLPSLHAGYELERKDTPGIPVDPNSTLKAQNTLDYVLVKNISRKDGTCTTSTPSMYICGLQYLIYSLSFLCMGKAWKRGLHMYDLIIHEMLREKGKATQHNSPRTVSKKKTASGGIRTHNRPLARHLSYQLSY